MEYNIEKKVQLDNFKKITDDYIIEVHDNYIWIHWAPEREIVDTDGKIILTYVTSESIEYLGQEFFMRKNSSHKIRNQVYKKDKHLKNIDNIIISNNNIIGISSDSSVLLDEDGNKISKKYKWISGFSNNVSPVGERKKTKDKFGFIDNLGNELISPYYDFVSGFRNGLASIRLRNKWGVIDDNLNIVISPTIKCNSLLVVSENLLVKEIKRRKIVTDFSHNIIYELKDNEETKIDRKNKIVYIYDKDFDNFNDINTKTDNNTLDLKIVNDSFRKGYKYSKIITSSYKIIDIRSYHIEEINSDNTIVFTDNSFGVLSKDYNISKKYGSIEYTCNGKYIVSKYKEYGIINREDKELFPTKCISIDYYEDGNYYIAITDTQNILLDKDINIIHKFRFYETIIQYKNSLTVILNDNEYFLLDSDFNIITSSKNQIYILNDNKVIIENYVIDLNCEYIDLNPVYELNIELGENSLSATFKTKEKLNQCIRELEKIEASYALKELFLNQEIELLESKIENNNKERINEIKKLIKEK